MAGPPIWAALAGAVATVLPFSQASVQTLTPATVAFGSVPVGRFSPAQTLTFSTNTELTLERVDAFGPFGVVVGGTCRLGRLAAGASCTIAVNFTPAEVGDQSGHVTVTYDGDTLRQSHFSGTGVPRPPITIPGPPRTTVVPQPRATRTVPPPPTITTRPSQTTTRPSPPPASTTTTTPRATTTSTNTTTIPPPAPPPEGTTLGAVPASGGSTSDSPAGVVVGLAVVLAVVSSAGWGYVRFRRPRSAGGSG